MNGTGAELRALIDREEILCCPGVHDPLTAAVADHVGFDALYMTGYGTSIAKTGYPDAGLITMPEMLENARNVQERIDVPLIADADNGYGGVANVVRTVREYIKTGVSGVHIEDQIFPKRCGHTKGRQLVPVEEAVGKIQAACDVRDERDEAFVVIARTDARGAVDGSLTEAIARMEAYVDAGADVAFVEGPTSEAELERVADAIDAPLLYNFVGDIGTSPYVELNRLEELGYDIVIFPVLSTLATITAVYEHLDRFKREGVGGVRRLDDAFSACPVGSLHEFSGLPEIVEWEKAYLPEAEQTKYEQSLGDDIE